MELGISDAPLELGELLLSPLDLFSAATAGGLVLVLSLGAVSLLNVLIRSGSAVNIASLFYLTPPTTALIAWLLFGETLTGLALLGMGLTVLGVWLARK